MAAALDKAWSDVELSGLVSTRYGHAVDAGRIEIIEAGHPIPDSASMRAAQKILGRVKGLSGNDLVIALISGGGSATLALPIDALTLEKKQAITRQLLVSGASISEMNTVRKHLSRIKGGKLAEAVAPARLCTLMISDVPGDNPGDIASGPTVPCDSTPADALRLMRNYKIDIPPAVLKHLESTPCTLHSTYSGETRIIASPIQALRAAAGVLESQGYRPIILGDAIECESRELGRMMAGIARSVKTQAEPCGAPAVLLSGGETLVSIGSDEAGRGGRNTEFALSLALALAGEPGIWALAADSDGIDGTEDAAGAIVSPDTLDRARAIDQDASIALQRHDSYSFFEAVNDLIRTGPTLTNVNDLRMVLIE